MIIDDLFTKSNAALKVKLSEITVGGIEIVLRRYPRRATFMGMYLWRAVTERRPPDNVYATAYLVDENGKRIRKITPEISVPVGGSLFLESVPEALNVKLLPGDDD